MTTDEVLDIMQPKAPLSDQQLARLEADADLREACQDVMMMRGMLAGQPDTDAALHRLKESKGVKEFKECKECKERVGVQKARGAWLRPLRSASLRGKVGAALVAASVVGVAFLLWTTLKGPAGQQLPPVPAPFEQEPGQARAEGITLDGGNGRQLALALSENDESGDVVLDVAKGMKTEAGSQNSPARGSHVVGQQLVGSSTLSVPYGHSVQVNLSDGTRVFLRPGSKLTYPDKFITSERLVSLVGEAYFCVAHDAGRPFMVATAQGNIRDYGTEFNVVASTKHMEVVLVEGCVGVTAKASGGEQRLQPGQKISITDAQAVIQTADTDPYKAWRDGYFYFNETPLGEIVQQLARSYNLSVECHNRSLMQLRLRYIIPRSSTAAYAVEILNRLQKGHVSLVDNCIIIR